MLELYVRARDAIRSFHGREHAQDGFEYLLVVGGISVAVVFAAVAAPGLIKPLVDAVKVAINTIPGIAIA